MKARKPEKQLTSNNFSTLDMKVCYRRPDRIDKILKGLTGNKIGLYNTKS